MILEIEISAQADIDLRNIYEYIAFELQSPENAGGQLDRLEKSIMRLNQMLERFREYEKEPWHSRGLHIIPVDNFCVLYIPDKEKAVVTIPRRRDFENTNYDDIKREYSIWACMNTVQISMNQVHLTNDTVVPLMRVFEFNDSKALIYVC